MTLKPKSVLVNRSANAISSEPRAHSNAPLIDTLEGRRLMSASLPGVAASAPAPTIGVIAQPAAPMAGAQTIKSFSLINTTNDSVVRTIVNGETVDLAALGLKREDVSVRANFDSESSVGSVKFDLTGTSAYHRVENHAGFYLFGGKGNDAASNNNQLHAGRNVVTATVYSQSGGVGASATPQQITFDIIDSANNGGNGGNSNGGGGGGTSTFNGTIAVVELVNTATGQDIAQLSGFNQTVDLGGISRETLSVVARPNSPVGSITFKLNDTSTIFENFAPYALFGDTTTHLNPGHFSSGLNTITLYPYASANGRGAVGPVVTVSFTLLD